jgi:hypothetical protein
MWRLVKLSALLIFMFTSVEGAAILLARDNNDQYAVPQLAIYRLTNQPDCAMPCWIGIQPAAFSVPTAKAAVETVFAPSPTFRILVDNTASEDVLRFLLIDRSSGQRDGPLVRISQQSVIINFQYAYPALRPTMGDIYNWLGQPDFVTHPQVTSKQGQYFYQLVYAGEGYTIFVSASAPRIVPESSVDSFVIMYLDVKQLYEIQAYSIMLRPWKGFSALDRYMLFKVE